MLGTSSLVPKYQAFIPEPWEADTRPSDSAVLSANLML